VDFENIEIKDNGILYGLLFIVEFAGKRLLWARLRLPSPSPPGAIGQRRTEAHHWPENHLPEMPL
jgi:hypothetical protein